MYSRLSWPAIALWLLASPTALGGPPSREGITPEKRYQDALSRGRERSRRGDHAGAVRQFKAALEVSADDPQALSELGSAALQMKDLSLAEQAARRSLEKAQDPELSATSLYNLGRIEEARGDRAKAVEAYKRSLGQRANPAARERLSALDPDAADQFNPWKPRPMDGPFASLEEYCRKVDSALDGGITALSCGVPPGDVKGDHQIEGVPKPLQAVRLVSERTTGDEALCGQDGCVEYVLAVQTARGWFISPPLAKASVSPWGFDHQRLSIEVFEMRDLAPAEGKEIILELRVSYLHGQADETSSGEKTVLVLAGAGPSGVPSASVPVTIGTAKTGFGSGGESARVHYELHEGGVLEITGDVQQLKPGGLRDLIGRYRLRFP
jgi:hypothetical protein